MRSSTVEQAAHNMRVNARKWVHDAEHRPEWAAESWAALEAAAVRYADALRAEA